MIKNKFGYGFKKMLFEIPSPYDKITGILILVTCHDQLLLVHHKNRNQWEFPAGTLEINESLLDCAMRELYEETSQTCDHLQYIGLAELVFQDAVDYQAVYMVKLNELKPFIKNDEVDAIKLYAPNQFPCDLDVVELEIFKSCTDIFG